MYILLFTSFPQTLERSLPGSYSYSPYSMNYIDNSFHGSNSSSYIQSTSSPQFHHQMFTQNVGVPPPTKSNFIRYGSNSELSKQGYELSQDLQDKQIELQERRLELKYGVRAQKSALVANPRKNINPSIVKILF